MGAVYIEHRELKKGASLSWDIAHHLYTRQLDGRVLIVCDRPTVLLASVRKQWMKMIQRLERERASMLSLPRVKELTRSIANMKSMKFSAGNLAYQCFDVWFADAGQAISTQTKFQTIYVTSESNVERVVERIEYHGLLVTYT